MKYLEVTITIRGFKTTYMYWTYLRVTGKNWCYVNIYSFLNDVLKNFYNDSFSFTVSHPSYYMHFTPYVQIFFLCFRKPPIPPPILWDNNEQHIILNWNIKNNFLSINYRDKEGTVFSLELRKITDWLFTNSIFFDPNK